jgi:DNA polymerase-4
VSYCKFVAKLASDQNKPDGLCVITPERAQAYIAALPVSRFHGIGPVTARKLEALGIMTGADLQERSLAELETRFGSSAAGTGASAGGSTTARFVRTVPTSRSAQSERSTMI